MTDLLETSNCFPWPAKRATKKTQQQRNICYLSWSCDLFSYINIWLDTFKHQWLIEIKKFLKNIKLARILNHPEASSDIPLSIIGGGIPKPPCD